ncbi:unnamed protein product [Blepharisma stoltei]|uniref:Uncharacterized protein n=1 Tax=Blepharisma stoltei TaxID=1481888 RepID=A0AAU9JJ91_9CILI|nr:unnamed protein product [Blepharisma stoltei]
MEQSKALAKHAKSQRKIDDDVKPIIINVFYVLLVVITLGAFMGYAINAIYTNPKSLMKDWGISSLTGPKWYMQNCFVFMWIFKLVSVVYILSKNSKLSEEFVLALRDIGITVAFVLEYYISLEIYYFSDRSFKLSGHALALSTMTCMILIECQRNASITNNKIWQNFGKFMLIFHCYILSWTSFAYHTYLELFSGLTIGILTIWLFHLLANKLITKNK